MICTFRALVAEDWFEPMSDQILHCKYSRDIGIKSYSHFMEHTALNSELYEMIPIFKKDIQNKFLKNYAELFLKCKIINSAWYYNFVIEKKTSRLPPTQVASGAIGESKSF